jgi:hypothetical protein
MATKVPLIEPQSRDFAPTPCFLPPLVNSSSAHQAMNDTTYDSSGNHVGAMG